MFGLGFVVISCLLLCCGVRVLFVCYLVVWFLIGWWGGLFWVVCACLVLRLVDGFGGVCFVWFGC